MKFNEKVYAAKEINDAVKAAGGNAVLTEVLGERFIACGLKEGKVEIHGTPGNALGAYLDKYFPKFTINTKIIRQLSFRRLPLREKALSCRWIF